MCAGTVSHASLSAECLALIPFVITVLQQRLTSNMNWIIPHQQLAKLTQCQLRAIVNELSTHQWCGRLGLLLGPLGLWELE